MLTVRGTLAPGCRRQTHVQGFMGCFFANFLGIGYVNEFPPSIAVTAVDFPLLYSLAVFLHLTDLAG